ncbi:hypothetical protein [Pelotomaculum propionicicum]|uniref:Uncharacterized protein n=1 Tax=Pelotomaculum propionicicum TaxID=258475 RepID=A0A4Y7RBE4_9FIRM|nr:hypothetical protein [Pelotomaculum propionicicum]TEB06328.1 hypothetical protein Pmgp_03780 [Pelotomaculum propionicicum]
MSCYLRHLKPILSEAGLDLVTKEERKRIDLAVRDAVAMKKEDKCNEVWKEVKVLLQDPDKKQSLLTRLKNI